MGLQEKISHAAETAKWKADQQNRLYKSKSKVNELKHQIRNQKARLAETALSLFNSGQLEEEILIQLCDEIVGLNKQITTQQQLQDEIKSEVAPLSPYQSTSLPRQEDIGKKSTAITEGMACPHCQANLPLGVLFCGKCGSAISETIDTKSNLEISNMKQCANCRTMMPSQAEFCPNCGLSQNQNIEQLDLE